VNRIFPWELAPKLVFGVPPKPLFSFNPFEGKGFSLNTSSRIKLMTVNIPKKIKHPSHPNLGNTNELATIPILAAIARAK
jgi:hypothetical protein